MRPLVAHCHLGLGTLYGRMSDTVRAHEQPSGAMTLYREMAMPFWLAKTQAEVGPPYRNSA